MCMYNILYICRPMPIGPLSLFERKSVLLHKNASDRLFACIRLYACMSNQLCVRSSLPSAFVSIDVYIYRPTYARTYAYLGLCRLYVCRPINVYSGNAKYYV